MHTNCAAAMATRRSYGYRKIFLKIAAYVVSVVFILMCWIRFMDYTEVRFRLHTGKEPGWLDVTSVVYRNCTKIPSSPSTRPWLEETYLTDQPIRSVEQMAAPDTSLAWIDGSTSVQLGDSVHVKIVLRDFFGNRRTTGGDLIRVWMRDLKNNASSSAHVVDHMNGNYSATLTAWWIGKPNIYVAIISPREVIATALQRRYICPPVYVNTAWFQSPEDPRDLEETPCSYDPDVPGYRTLCNLTQDNYGSPWYCGKPSGRESHCLGPEKENDLSPNDFDLTVGMISIRVSDEDLSRLEGDMRTSLTCSDWTRVGSYNLHDVGLERTLLTPIQYEIMSPKYHAMMLPKSIPLSVMPDDKNATRIIPPAKCNQAPKAVTWQSSSPSGYLYNKKWTSKHCTVPAHDYSLHACVNNTNIILIGDSTLRQFYLTLMDMIPCVAVNEINKKWKHAPVSCVNSSLNYELTLWSHLLPFCTRAMPRQYFKSFKSILEQVQGTSKVIIIMNMYAHILQYHSHVFRDIVRNMKSGIISVLQRNPNVHIFIKGPHAFSFNREPNAALWMPDIYYMPYTQILYDEFSDLQDRVVFLDGLDITVSTEQYHIHATQYVITAMIRNMFGYICDY